MSVEADSIELCLLRILELIRVVALSFMQQTFAKIFLNPIILLRDIGLKGLIPAPTKV